MKIEDILTNKKTPDPENNKSSHWYEELFANTVTINTNHNKKMEIFSYGSERVVSMQFNSNSNWDRSLLEMSIFVTWGNFREVCEAAQEATSNSTQQPGKIMWLLSGTMKSTVFLQIFKSCVNWNQFLYLPLLIPQACEHCYVFCSASRWWYLY